MCDSDLTRKAWPKRVILIVMMVIYVVGLVLQSLLFGVIWSAVTSVQQ